MTRVQVSLRIPGTAPMPELVKLSVAGGHVCVRRLVARIPRREAPLPVARCRERPAPGPADSRRARGRVAGAHGGPDRGRGAAGADDVDLRGRRDARAPTEGRRDRLRRDRRRLQLRQVPGGVAAVGRAMVKEVFFFTEMGYTAYPQDDARRRGYNNLMFPNEHFSAERARELYAMYFDELVYCTETGFDGIMINEHHNNPLSMMPSVNVIGAVLARATREGRIVFLGNVLPIHDNPLRVAEEVAMIDILSGGRVVCGFVRGLGQESLATNVNPAYNRERFDEAHDVIVKAWTTPGPFRWAGRHYDYRALNPWMRPLQKPHPPIWIPGVVSPESVRWAAEHRYPYVALAPPLDVIDEIYDLYDDVALETGFTPTAEHRGYVIRVSVADTDAEAYEQGRQFYWQLGTSFGIAPRQWLQPAGYVSHAARASRREQARTGAVNITPGGPALSYEGAHATYQIVSGNPDTVVKKLQHIIDLVDPAYMTFWGREGLMSHDAAIRSIDLMTREVIPAVKAYRPVGREKMRAAG